MSLRRAESIGRTERIADERRGLDHLRDAVSAALRLNRSKGPFRSVGVGLAVRAVMDEAVELGEAWHDLTREPTLRALAMLEREAADVGASVAILLDAIASAGEDEVEALAASQRSGTGPQVPEDIEGRLMAARQRVRTDEARVVTLARVVAASSSDGCPSGTSEVVDALGAAVRALERSEERLRLLQGLGGGSGHA